MIASFLFVAELKHGKPRTGFDYITGAFIVAAWAVILYGVIQGF
jgi:hypothetical protein